MIYERFIGNRLQLEQSVDINIKIEEASNNLVLEQTVRTNFIIKKLRQTLGLNHGLTVRKSIINQSIEQKISFDQSSHPNSRYFNILHTVNLTHDTETVPYGPINQSLNLNQSVDYYLAKPTNNQLSLTQSVHVNVIRNFIVTQVLEFEHSSVSLPINSEFVQNRGAYIPPNATEVYDVNERKFVNRPLGDFTYNPITGYWENGSVVTNGVVKWP
jgi:hypothetical protein